MDILIQYGREIGLEGRELHQFIETQQTMKRDKRAENRRLELAKLELKVDIEKEKKGGYRERTIKDASCSGIEK